MRRGERDSVLDLLERAFPGQRDLFARYMKTDPALHDSDTLLVFDGERPVSCVQIFTKQIRLRGETVALGGIGSVGTDPDYRRRGLARSLLVEAAADMERRGMALALLFGDEKLYQRLGWVALPRTWLSIHALEQPPAVLDGLRIRPFEPADLPSVCELYDSYCRDLDGTTVRDAEYWRGQLRYAGDPDEIFRVAERAGRIVAYLRIASPPGVLLMEHAREQAAADALIALVLDSIPEGKALVAMPGPDAELEELARGAGARVDSITDTSMMWRVLNANKLTRLAGTRWSAPTLLESLVSAPRALYWPSDRF